MGSGITATYANLSFDDLYSEDPSLRKLKIDGNTRRNTSKSHYKVLNIIDTNGKTISAKELNSITRVHFFH